MPTKKKTKKSSTAREAVIAKMKKKQAELNRESGGGNGENVFDDLVYGKNYRRILPRNSDDEVFYFQADIHFRVGPDAKTVRCIGDKCPVCKKCDKEVARVNKQYPRGSEAGKAAWKTVMRQFGPTTRYYANVYNTSKGADKAIKVLSFGQMILNDLIDVFVDEELGGDFTDPETGCSVIIIKKGDPKKPQFNKYEVKVPGKTRPIRNWDTIAEERHDLEAIAGELLSVAEIRKIMDGTDEEPEEDDYDDYEDDEYEGDED